jgi:low temperature requirement protein LtrA
MSSDHQSNWIRKQDPDQEKASFPELFFDLVFVFALVQLSHTLASDLSYNAVFEALLVILAIWWIWIHTTWVTNLLDTTKEPVRLFLFSLMFGGVLLGVALPEAFGEQGLEFAAIYTSMHIVRTVFTLYAFRGIDDASFLTFFRIAVWTVVSSGFWFAGAFLDLELRAMFWTFALLIEYMSPAVRYYVPGFGKSPKETLDVSGEHMAERCALFVIICLGETILTTGRNASDNMNSNLSFAVFCSAFLSTGFMWWIYFHHGQPRAADKAENTSKPETVAQNLFTYGHLPIIAGIILAAVGEELSLSHADEKSSLTNGLAMLGGPALFLLGNMGVKLAAARELPVSHVAGLVLLATAAVGLPFLENHLVQFTATAILLVVALWEYLGLRRSSSTA